MFNEVISPNVKFILPSAHLDVLLKPNKAQLHPHGVIEIDMDASRGVFKLMVDTMFEQYRAAGAVYPVSVTGLPSASNDAIGSHRFCAWDPMFAKSLTEAIQSLAILQVVQEPYALYQFEAVSKYFRFMQYKDGGEHYPHYDSDFCVDNGYGIIRYVTRYSMVMYFDDCETGEIAFIDKDPFNDSNGSTADWPRQANEDEIFLKIKPRAGKLVLFPHKVCHTVLPFTDKGKVRRIARGDLIFTRIFA